MAVNHMMRLGDYTFSINSAAYQTLSRTTEYRWAAQARVGRSPARQFMGQGDERLSLDGRIYPHFKGGLGQVDAMRREAGKGCSLILVDGVGKIRGRWVIEQVEETWRAFFDDGAPRCVEFRLQLSRYGEDR